MIMKTLAKKLKEAPISALKIAPNTPAKATVFATSALPITLRALERALSSNLYASNLSSLSKFWRNLPLTVPILFLSLTLAIIFVSIIDAFSSRVTSMLSLSPLYLRE